MEHEVILVDPRGEEVGTAGKLDAHRRGLLHRAFSIFIHNPAGQLLLQQRAADKYHSGGLWSNTCCSHPRPGEATAAAAHRRLQEEMGFDCELQEVLQFTYHARLDNGLTEHEYDHVLLGTFAGDPRPDPSEVADWRWVDLPALLGDVQRHPERYTSWFRIVLGRVVEQHL